LSSGWSGQKTLRKRQLRPAYSRLTTNFIGGMRIDRQIWSSFYYVPLRLHPKIVSEPGDARAHARRPNCTCAGGMVLGRAHFPKPAGADMTVRERRPISARPAFCRCVGVRWAEVRNCSSWPQLTPPTLAAFRALEEIALARNGKAPPTMLCCAHGKESQDA
jgi:hypothetical protein